MTNTLAGYAALAGKPNAGKSTLLNALLNQKIAIATSKPQTTRKRILGILTEENHQIIFLDTPGMIHPRYLLQERMMEYVSRSLHDADVILLILDASNEKDVAEAIQPDFLKKSKIPVSKPVLLILNKIDLVTQDVIEKYFLAAEATGLYKQIIPLSATLGVNTRSIIDFVLDYIPEHPFFFPEDIVSDEQERFFVKEIIREKILTQYREEIPYSCEVSIDEFTERETKHFIRAIIYVEKESQVSIIVGKKGALIKKLGERSRADIEKFLDHEVYLELRVKVRDSWRRNEKYLREFGYDLQDD
jgi:GTP-binding protein Era